MERTSQTLKQKVEILSSLVSRSALMGQLGQSFQGKRDLYESLGYPQTLVFSDYISRYTRQDIAKRLVNAYPDACWSKHPEIKEVDNKDTEFEKSWKLLLKQIHVWSYFKRVDKISGIGRYAILLMGFDDGKSLDKPVTKATKILYLRPFNEIQANITEWENDINNERYGLPKFYNLTVSQPTNNSNLSNKILKVHHSRVLHIADELSTDDIYGTPRLEAVYNRLQDLELIAGGGAEMWWRGAFPGLGFKATDGATFNEADIPALESEIEDYIHGLKRFMKLKNIDIQQLTPTISDSTKQFDVEMTLISIASGIPKRILIGSERGELASSQDSSEWDDRVEERRDNFCAPYIIQKFIDALIFIGVLPTPPNGYSIYWAPMHIMGEKEKAEIARTWTEAITKYAGTPGTELVIPHEVFLRTIMGKDDDEIAKIVEVTEALEEEQEAEDKKLMEDSLALQKASATNPQSQAGAKAEGTDKGGTQHE